MTTLRARMAAQGWQAVLLPSSDPHLSLQHKRHG